MRTIPTVRNLLLLPLMATCAAGQTKPIPIGVKVEAEGGGEGQGMWDRPAQDLAPKELKALESLVVGEIGKQPGVKIVPLDSSSDYIAVVVVAAKLRNGNIEENWYIASSVVTIATTKGIDELVTHDVVAAADLTSVARSIGFQFASARLRTAYGALEVSRSRAKSACVCPG